MDKKVLDYALVPLGLFIMTAYHAWLLRRIVKHPTKTVVGVTAINRRFWVQAMMEVMWFVSLLSFVSPEMLLDLSSFSWHPTCVAGCLQDWRPRPVQTLENNIMASTLLASTAITLSSLIAVVLMTSGNGNQSSLFIFGDRSKFGFSVKFFAILVCFLVAFLMNVQSVRYYSHASILINVPCGRYRSTSTRQWRSMWPRR
ncbi:hypothetical protein NL676_018618 [Syzygium grande]|nr:hypothetical protein NL676_018618 [Syzygium grande]